MLYKDGYLLSGGSYIIKGEREGKTHFEKGIKATDITDKKALQFFAKLFNLPTIELNGKIFKLNRQSLKNSSKGIHLKVMHPQKAGLS